MPLLGSHLSVAGAFTNAVDEARRLGCRALQVFTKAPSQWRGRPIGDEEARAFRQAVKAAGIKRTMAHDSYLINIASPEPGLYRQSIEALFLELQRAELLGINYLVMHPGAHLCAGETDALARVVTALDEIHERTAGFKIRILIENTAGQGSCIGHRFEHLAAILRGVQEPRRLGVCLDTCHTFAAGYALTPLREYRRTFEEFDRVVGMKHVKAFHLNDSLKEFGSRVDRHAHIGQGKIGSAAFRYIVNDPQFAKLPMVLETPKENNMDEVNLRLLRRMCRAPRPSS
ncbi:MAG: deoxyribonuclease IV [Gemmataceae bacterium]